MRPERHQDNSQIKIKGLPDGHADKLVGSEDSDSFLRLYKRPVVAYERRPNYVRSFRYENGRFKPTWIFAGYKDVAVTRHETFEVEEVSDFDANEGDTETWRVVED